MKEIRPEGRVSIPRLILIPALISLAVTLLRLVGELRHWSGAWFSTEASGIQPSGTSWLVGISWLPIPFGIYFAYKLWKSGERPSSAGKSIAYALGAAVVVVLVLRLVIPKLPVEFPRILLFIWLPMAAGAGIQLLAWPKLVKTLFAYGLAARIPVIVVMFLAMRGRWGTHYDYVGYPEVVEMGFWPGYLWLAFFPQLIFWVSFTIVLGSLAGGVTALILGSRRRGTLAAEG
jgi:hypothetical protein